MQLARQIDDEVVSAAIGIAPPSVQLGVGAIGDGTILKAIIDFLKSDLGKALISIILSLIMI